MNISSGSQSFIIGSSAIYAENGLQKLSVGPVEEIVESASTIKIVILIMACEKNQAYKHGLSHIIKRLPRHKSNGSGVLEWAHEPGHSYSIRYLIYYMMAYSDCLATNILIDYVGGKQSINKWLRDNGYQTRLRMGSINFKATDTYESVGTTNAREICDLFARCISNDWHPAYRHLINASTSETKFSWAGHELSVTFPDVKSKTGSMVNCPPDGITVINIAGYIPTHSIFFSLCSSGTALDDNAADLMRDELIGQLIKQIEVLAKP